MKLESKVIVFEFSKEFVDNSMDFGYHCKTRFSLSMHTTGQLQGHHIVIRNVEDLVVGGIVKVRIIYERYRLDEDFYLPADDPYFKKNEYEYGPFSFTFDTSGHNFDAFRSNFFHPNS